MRVFVTGAGGFIGSHLCEALRDAGHDVTGMAHYRSQDTFGWLDEVDGVEKVRGDIRDLTWLEHTVGNPNFKRCEAVYHLAALGSVPYSYMAAQSFVDTNVTGTLNALHAARFAPNAKFIHMSTSEVYGTAQYEPQDEKHPINPQSPYAASKVAADALVTAFAATYGMNCVIVRPFNTYGPRQSERALVATLIRQFLDPACEIVETGDSKTKRDLTYVRDTVGALVNALTVEGLGPFNVGTGKSIEVGDLSYLICTLTKIPKKIRRSGVERLRPDGSEVRALRCAPSDIMPWAYQSLEDGLRKTIEWWRGRPFRKDIGNLI